MGCYGKATTLCPYGSHIGAHRSRWPNDHCGMGREGCFEVFQRHPQGREDRFLLATWGMRGLTIDMFIHFHGAWWIMMVHASGGSIFDSFWRSGSDHRLMSWLVYFICAFRGTESEHLLDGDTGHWRQRSIHGLIHGFHHQSSNRKPLQSHHLPPSTVGIPTPCGGFLIVLSFLTHVFL